MAEIDKILETYFEDFRTIRGARIREAEKRDEVFLKVTSGALVLSVSFLTLSGFENIVSSWLIIGSWICLLLSVVLQLIAYIAVEFHFVRFERDLEKWRKGGLKADQAPTGKTRWEIFTWTLNYSSYLLAIGGLLLLVIFGYYNLKAMTISDGKKFANPLAPTVISPVNNPGSVNPAPTQPPTPLDK